MSQEIEIEFKNLLDPHEYKKLLTELPFPDEGVVQTNHYFETKDFSLKAHGAALRIREKNGKYTLTLKEPHPDGLLETHDALTKQETESWLNGTPLMKDHVGGQLKALGIAPDTLQLFGSLTTERREVKDRGALLVLDYSTYNGESDYELEIEATDRTSGEHIFKQILMEFDVTEKHTPNKIERFYRSIGLLKD